MAAGPLEYQNRPIAPAKVVGPGSFYLDSKSATLAPGSTPPEGGLESPQHMGKRPLLAGQSVSSRKSQRRTYSASDSEPRSTSHSCCTPYSTSMGESAYPRKVGECHNPEAAITDQEAPDSLSFRVVRRRKARELYQSASGT